MQYMCVEQCQNLWMSDQLYRVSEEGTNEEFDHLTLDEYGK